MPAPSLNFVPNGPGWPSHRARQGVLANHGQGSGPPIAPQSFAHMRGDGCGIDGMGSFGDWSPQSMGDWVDLNAITQPSTPAGPWSPPLEQARYGPWKSAPLAPQPWQVPGGRGPMGETSRWAVPAPSIPLRGVGDWMELSGLGAILPDKKHYGYLAAALLIGLGICWYRKSR
ncbi:MAG: hypothetical protein E4G90_04730 [Gemmatimonadales bacterium]|nr:MAG: hypothetical protein E4G90_04730 [Gemmatimonadales bacterium]